MPLVILNLQWVMADEMGVACSHFYHLELLKQGQEKDGNSGH